MDGNETLEAITGLWRCLTQEPHGAWDNQSSGVWRMAGVSGPVDKAMVMRREMSLVAVTRTVPSMSPRGVGIEPRGAVLCRLPI